PKMTNGYWVDRYKPAAPLAPYFATFPEIPLPVDRYRHGKRTPPNQGKTRSPPSTVYLARSIDSRPCTVPYLPLLSHLSLLSQYPRTFYRLRPSSPLSRRYGRPNLMLLPVASD